MEFTTIVLPTRAQPDTIVAIFLLKRLGGAKFKNVEEARIEVWQNLPDGLSNDSVDDKGVILLDIGGGKFDHHNRIPKTTTSQLVAEYLGIKDDQAIAKLLEYAKRDDFYGKGTISSDPLDRAFGLSGLVASLNRKYVEDHAKVVEAVLPLLEAHYEEEVRRTKELPEEFNKKVNDGKVEILNVGQKDKKLKCIFIEANSASMSGFLRSKNGGGFDVVIQRMESGHTNILTRPTKRVDLRRLVGIIREAEMMKKGIERNSNELISVPGRIEEVPEWYYDPATNSIQNGGLNPTSIPPTQLSREELIQLSEIGLTF